MDRCEADLAVLGGGPAGYVAALRAARLGGKVTLIEQGDVGGTCLNRGCIPTKALLKTAETAATIAGAAEFGIEADLTAVDWTAAVKRKDRIVKNLRTGVEQLLDAAGVTLLRGTGRVIGPRQIAVEGPQGSVDVRCKNLLLAAGAQAALPPIPGIDSPGVITSTEALAMESLPRELVIIGAGVIGLEFASILAPLGVRVTVLEAMEQILPGVDADTAQVLMRSVRRSGVRFQLSAAVKAIEETPEGLTVRYERKGKAAVQPCEKVLAAVGRRPDTRAFHALDLSMAGPVVVTDEHMATSIPGVYAAGDLTAGPLLAHKAFMQGRIAAENAMGLAAVMPDAVPSCVYTTPELATVGLTEEAARAAGINACSGRFELRQNGRALTLGKREGSTVIITDGDGVIIGARILAPHASEMISELSLAIRLKARVSDLADLIHPHPTLSESIWETCEAMAGKPVHSL